MSEPTGTAPAEPLGHAGNPWEQRDRLGFLNGLLENAKLFILSPGEAFDRTKLGGDFGGPLLYAILISWAAGIVAMMWQVAQWVTFPALIPAEMRGELDELGVMLALIIPVWIIMIPIALTIALFIYTCILHVCVMIVGADAKSSAGFEGTFRAITYAQTANVAQVVPIVGGLIAIIWSLVLQVVGIARIHGTTEGRAVVAVLIPFGLLCICCVGAAFILFGMIAAAAAGQH